MFINAGYGVPGEVEVTAERIARGMFDVNFFGVVNVTKEAVRIFRETIKPRDGRFIRMCSAVVHYDPNSAAFYAATEAGE